LKHFSTRLFLYGKINTVGLPNRGIGYIGLFVHIILRPHGRTLLVRQLAIRGLGIL